MKRIKHGVMWLILMIAALTILSSVIYHSLEGWGWVDSFYVTVLTITTLGHSNLTPSTAVSKIFTTFVAFIGIAMVLTLFGIVSSHYTRIAFENQKKNK